MQKYHYLSVGTLYSTYMYLANNQLFHQERVVLVHCNQLKTAMYKFINWIWLKLDCRHFYGHSYVQSVRIGILYTAEIDKVEKKPSVICSKLIVLSVEPIHIIRALYCERWVGRILVFHFQNINICQAVWRKAIWQTSEVFLGILGDKFSIEFSKLHFIF
jgi:hypothetical protein